MRLVTFVDRNASHMLACSESAPPHMVASAPRVFRRCFTARAMACLKKAVSRTASPGIPARTWPALIRRTRSSRPVVLIQSCASF